jgi:hypothetical protein
VSSSKEWVVIWGFKETTQSLITSYISGSLGQNTKETKNYFTTNFNAQLLFHNNTVDIMLT